MFIRLWIRRKYILKKASSVTVSIYALLGFVRMFVALEGFFERGTPFLQKIVVSSLILLAVWLVCLIGVGVFVSIKRKKKLFDGQNGKAVYVMYGDLFSEKNVRKSDTRRNICFAVNRCFDTIVNNQLIASASVHGAALNRLYSENIFTPATLNAVIQKTISPSARGRPSVPAMRPSPPTARNSPARKTRARSEVPRFSTSTSGPECTTRGSSAGAPMTRWRNNTMGLIRMFIVRGIR